MLEKNVGQTIDNRLYILNTFEYISSSSSNNNSLIYRDLSGHTWSPYKGWDGRKYEEIKGEGLFEQMYFESGSEQKK